MATATQIASNMTARGNVVGFTSTQRLVVVRRKSARGGRGDWEVATDVNGGFASLSTRSDVRTFAAKGDAASYAAKLVDDAATAAGKWW